MTDVNVNLGLTISLGNYNSAKLNFGVSDGVREGENVDQAFERVYAFVEAKLVQKQQELMKELEG